VRTKRPQCDPFAWRSGAASGTVTGVARMSVIFIVDVDRVEWARTFREVRGTSKVLIRR